MGSDRASSWWDEYNKGIRRLQEAGATSIGPPLSQDIYQLLNDVDDAFATTGAENPAWPDPHPEGIQPNASEYEHCSDPDKFRIVVARARAWEIVLVDRGWARQTSHLRWALRPYQAGGVDLALEPFSSGAVPLVLTTHTPVSDDRPFTVTISAGDPAVRLATIPDCGCDACDNGSDTLLKDMDMWILSVVDGSLQVDVSPDQFSVETSFGAEVGGIQDLDEPVSFTAAPWADKWTARPLVPDLRAHRPKSESPRAMIGSAFNALRGLLGKPGGTNEPQIYRARRK